MLHPNNYSIYFKKSVFFLFLILCTKTNSQTITDYTSGEAQYTKTVKERGLKGKVKSLKTCYFTIEKTNNGNVKGLLNPNIYGFYEIFNDSGRMIKYYRLKPPVYFPIDEFRADSITYNKKGKLDKIFYTNGVDTKCIKHYNDNEDVILNEEIKEDKELIDNQHYSYKYNSTGKKTEAIEYSYYGSQKNIKKEDHKSLYKYDNKGRLIEELRYGELLEILIPKVEVPIKFSYKYDINGNIIEESCFYKTLIYKNTFNYNSQNIITKQELIQKSKICITYFDENGFTSKKTITDKNNYRENRVYKFEFDIKGNWTKLNVSTDVFENGKKQIKPEVLITNEINYYE